MVAINSHFPEPIRKGPGRRPESVDPSDLIWQLHRVIADPAADLRSVKRAKEQLLRTAYITAARADATVTNNLAHQVIDAQGKIPPSLVAPAK